jgi:UDP-N-acetyl-D-mannosaminuronic acid dehydrogenase
VKNNETLSVSVLGLGYIGLPTSALLASVGYTVKGIDVNESTVEIINQGKIHIVEPDLDAFVSSAVSSGLLTAFSTVQPADVYIICVPTPFRIEADAPVADLSYVKQAARSIAPHIKPGDIVILESTSPVGATQLVSDTLQDSGVDISLISLAYCPERVLPGKIMSELISNDRVIGGINSYATRKVAEFYKTFVKGEILETTAETAEMCKLTENSFRDVNIAFANELSMICDRNGVDVHDLIKLANHHPRVDILQPGTGVGGHCIAVDPWFLVSGDPDNTRIIKMARQVNDSKPHWVVNKIIERQVSIDGAKLKIACLGIAFKPNIDDLRESPAVLVVEKLVQFGHEVSVVEPNIESHSNFTLVSLEELDDFDVIAVLVKHQEFDNPQIKSYLQEKNTLDFCGLFSH